MLKLIGSKKPVDFDIKNAKNVLFFRYDRIGDMVITTPVFRELKLAYPHLKITVLASIINKDVLLNNPHIENVVTTYKNNIISNLPLLLKLRKKNFDVCIEFDHSVVPHAIIRLKIIKPKKVISIKKDGRYGVNGNELSLYDIYTEKPKKGHFRDIWLGVLKPFNVNPKSNEYELFVTKKLENKAKVFLKQYSTKFLVGINLEGAIRGKKIRFSELYKISQGLYKQVNNVQIIILTAPKKFQSVSKKVKQMGLDYVEISYKTDNIPEVASIINQLDLIITPDTSIVHIASAFNKPIVTIHENNQDSYKLFSPTSKLHRTVFSKSKDDLNDFSVELLLSYCFKLINLNTKVDYE